MQIKRIQLLLLALIGGVLMGLSFPFSGSVFPLGFIALVPLILINFHLNEQKKGRFFLRFGLNYLYFILFNFITTWWIYNASEGGMYMAVICNSILMTLPFLFTGFIARQLGENRGLLAMVVLWVSFEYAHYYWELSWPWLSFGHILGDYPKLIQWYEFSGVTGGTLWIVLINVLVYFVVRNLWLRKESLKIQAPFFLFIAIGLLFPILSSLIIYYNYEEKIDPVNIIVVQPNIDSYTEKFETPVQDQLLKIFDLVETEISTETDLIVCPETAISYPVDEDNLESEITVMMIKSFLRNHHNVPMLIGADSYRYFEHENSTASRWVGYYNAWLEGYNASFLIDPNRPVQIYHKAKPVLGAEKVPFINWFPALKEYSVELGGTSGVIGLGEEPLNLKHEDLQVAPLICYESVYGDYVSYFTARGADILCVITNDGWWGNTPGYKQHRLFSQIRAIENRRSLARSANTGISCMIDQRGEIISEIGWDEAGILHENLNRNKEITFFVQYGDVFGRISLFLAIAMFIYAITTFLKTTGIADKSKLSRK